MNNPQKKPLWQPPDPNATNMAKFMAYLNQKHALRLRTYDDLWKWSVAPSSIRQFWRDAYIFLALPQGSAAGDIAFTSDSLNITPNLFPPPSFFPSTTLNLAEFILRDRTGVRIAIHFVREGKPRVEHISWDSLRSRTTKAYDAMVSSGIKAGDKVAVVMSNSADAIVLCLAALAIGAVWSSASPELGTQAIIDRYRQIQPRVIFADDGYVYAGKNISLEERIVSWSRLLKADNPHLQDVVIVPYSGIPIAEHKVACGVSWQDFLQRGTGRGLSFLQTPFGHPAFILFSSGTTGIPKCIVHSAGGVALKVNTDSQLQHDMRPDDVFFQYTTTAWVMWILNFVNLSIGGTMLLYDGSPFHPQPDILLRLVQEFKVTVFGTSPRYLSELRSKHIVPKHYNLTNLRMVTSTGSVLTKEMYNWFYQHGFPTTTQLISMSGGTDIAVVGGCPILPVYPGEIQAKCLGMSVEVFDAAATDPILVETKGQAGELVCTQPFPSQPLAFLGDGGQEDRRVWCQGDFVQVLPDTKGIVMMGRSDGVLNPSGVRFGSAEIYAVTETHPQIQDAICVGQRRALDHDEKVLLFVKMKPLQKLSSELIASITEAIKEQYSARHVPAYIFQVADIPYTVNGKKCEINVKQIVSGMSTQVSGTVANPECLKEYEQYLHLPGLPGNAKARI
ncbi:hypothetical protein BDV18DRAFT_167923 [Aspergillus unguis]